MSTASHLRVSELCCNKAGVRTPRFRQSIGGHDEEDEELEGRQGLFEEAE